jgi:predicted secreted hydrolase
MGASPAPGQILRGGHDLREWDGVSVHGADGKKKTVMRWRQQGGRDEKQSMHPLTDQAAKPSGRMMMHQ